MPSATIRRKCGSIVLIQFHERLPQFVHRRLLCSIPVCSNSWLREYMPSNGCSKNVNTGMTRKKTASAIAVEGVSTPSPCKPIPLHQLPQQPKEAERTANSQTMRLMSACA